MKSNGEKRKIRHTSTEIQRQGTIKPRVTEILSFIDITLHVLRNSLNSVVRTDTSKHCVCVCVCERECVRRENRGG